MKAARDTIAAIASPPGRGAVGIVRISGVGVPAVMAGLVGERLVPRHATLVAFKGREGEILDQGIALYFPGPRSFTGEDVLELHGHGGPAVLALLLSRCLEHGARIAQPGEFTQRAFLNGKLDLAQAEGVADLIDAATATAARAAARSLSGAFSSEVRALVEELVDLRVLVEASLDFPEEDIEFVRGADALARLEAIGDALRGLLARSRQGALLRDGLTVVLVGQPNVGKSSLLNRLAGQDVAIVTAHAGTTRDALRSTIEIGGIPVTVVDTAGLRPTDDPIETLGIDRTWAAIGEADLVLLLVDVASASVATSGPDAEILARLPTGLPCVVVHNKIDLRGQAARAGADPAHRRWDVWLSAKTGDGLDLLRRTVLEVADAHEDMEGTFLARERHLDALRQAEGRLVAARAHLDGARPALELVAEELRRAQDAVGAITGAFSSEDLLGAIFSRFCIGK